jgi:competence protein ComEC
MMWFNWKKIWLSLLLFLACYSGKGQSIVIHHIGVGQGDGTLLFIKNKEGDTASILIDAGNSAGKGDLTYGVLKQYLGVRKYIDFIIISHLHSDHMGGMKQVLGNMLKDGWTVGAVLDRVAGDVPGSYDICYDALVDFFNDPVPPEPSTQLVKTYATAVKTMQSAKRLIHGWYNLNCGVDLLHTPVVAASFKTSALAFRCLTSNGFVCTTATDYSKNEFVAKAAHNENDYSYSFLFEMGGFKYFTGGDIGGASPYVDLETPLVNLFKTRSDNSSFHFCGYKATHHGSPNSTNPAFVSYTLPTVTVVPSALRSFSGTQLPGQATLQRIANSSTNTYLYYTYQWANGSNAYSGSVATYRDVVLAIDSTDFDKTRHINVKTVQRDKSSLDIINGTATNDEATCKKHDGPLRLADHLLEKTLEPGIALPVPAPHVNPCSCPPAAHTVKKHILHKHKVRQKKKYWRKRRYIRR